MFIFFFACQTYLVIYVSGHVACRSSEASSIDFWEFVS